MSMWTRKRPDSHVPAKPQSFTGPAKYRLLHKYLDERYADTVVLTMAQIESLIGSVLPDIARNQGEWWASAADRDSPSDQSRSWTQASRTATPNLLAQFVTFERAI
jgi:hypothetical protein